MNKRILLPFCFALATAAFFVACNKDIEDRTAELAPLTPVNIDANAGVWKPILLAAPTDISVPTPVPTTSPDYVVQLAEIKSFQANITADDQRILRYWGAGAVLRWNEIMRELVAKHNRPPYQNPDGTYPLPSAANPLAYPTFPFANPPYAARAYAYVAAAQYDALVSAWHYKKLYNRAAPHKVDAGVKSLLPASDLPSYPSEDAVVSGAAVELLKLLFPGDGDWIQAKANEQKRARLLSGANVRSDLEAGEALGRNVAAKFVARARTDRAGVAAGNAAMWTALENSCMANGETPWLSLELPKRPPMLMAFGKVKGFLVDSLTCIALRPPPPPKTGSDAMRRETEEVYNAVQNPSREQMRIVHFWADGVGTFTPPGHWNAIAAEDFVGQNFSEVRWARNMALLNMSLMDAAIVCWDTKMHYFNPRPSQLNPAIKTLTGLPNFPSYMSGHSTFSGAAARVLGHIVPARSAAYSAMAKEASESRLLGGIHFRSDCEAGLMVGEKVGAFAVARARMDGAE